MLQRITFGYGAWRMVLAMIAIMVVAAGARAEQADLQAVLTLVGDQYVLGQPIAFTVTLKNVGPRALRLRMGSREVNRFELEIMLLF